LTIRILFNSPRIWLTRIANITVPAARAIWRLALVEVVTGEDYNQSFVLRAAGDDQFLFDDWFTVLAFALMF